MEILTRGTVALKASGHLFTLSVGNAKSALVSFILGNALFSSIDINFPLSAILCQAVAAGGVVTTRKDRIPNLHVSEGTLGGSAIGTNDLKKLEGET